MPNFKINKNGTNENIMINEVHLLKNVFEKKPSGNRITLSELFNQIKTGNGNIPKYTQLKQLNKAEPLFKAIKSSLPAIIFGSTCISDYTDKSSNTYTQLMYLDIDAVKGNIDEIKSIIFDKYDFIIGIWKSCSGKGLGMVASVNQITSSKDYKECYKQLYDLFKEDLDIELDLSCASPTKKTFVSHDPMILTSEKFVSFSFLDGGGEKECNIPVNENMNKYYPETKIDVHYSNLMNTDVVINQGEGVHFCFDGLPSVRNLGRNSKIKDGQRHRALSMKLYLLMYLNKWDKNKLYNWFLEMNSVICHKPLSEKEINDLFSFCFQNFNPEKIIGKQKYTWFDSSCNLEKGQKISIARKNIKLRSIQLIEQAVNKLNVEGKKYTYKDIELITGLKQRTIERYMSKTNVKKPAIKCNINSNNILHLKAENFTKKEKTQYIIEQAIEEMKKENKKINPYAVAEHTGYSSVTVRKYYYNYINPATMPENIIKEEMEKVVAQSNL